jgi:CRP/FNR family transcriptional regulator
MAIDIAFLKSIPYFEGLSPTELDAIKQVIFEKIVQRGDTIALEGETAEALYFVGSGAVKMFKTSADGKEQILNIVRPGEPFNEVPVFDGGPNPASAQAMGPVTLYGIRKRDLDTVLREYPQVALNAINVLVGRMRHLVSLVEDLSFRHVVGRVARILLENAGNGKAPRQQLTQQDMAAMAGTAREVVSRALKTLEAQGGIRIDRRRIVITDREALENVGDLSH